MKMDSVIVRQARDDFEALQVANAMQSLLAVEVISIVFQNGVWHIFAKYASECITPDDIDRVIDAALNENR